MRIVFICGSMEAGQDGVGDYVRVLAANLILLGASVAVVAWNDKHAQTMITEEQQAGSYQLAVLRLPVNMAAGRLEAAQKFVNTFNPDWLSLQFVPFSFNPKGLPFSLGRQMADLGKGLKWQIMFHELWVGMDLASPMKHVAWGWLQKQLIKSIIRKLKPAVIHTQTTLYQAYLTDLGYAAQYLPLFGNVPPVGKVNELSAGNKPLITLVIFGNIHHGGLAENFAADAAAYSKASGINMLLQTVGRCGQEEEAWTGAWRNAGLEAETFGPQTTTRISEILTNATFGLSTTPLALIDKSGSVAAMLEHHLPVICTARDWQPRVRKNITPPAGIFNYKPGNLAELIIQQLKDTSMGNHVDVVANQLLNTLSSYNGKL